MGLQVHIQLETGVKIEFTKLNFKLMLRRGGSGVGNKLINFFSVLTNTHQQPNLPIFRISTGFLTIPGLRVFLQYQVPQVFFNTWLEGGGGNTRDGRFSCNGGMQWLGQVQPK